MKEKNFKKLLILLIVTILVFGALSVVRLHWIYMEGLHLANLTRISKIAKAKKDSTEIANFLKESVEDSIKSAQKIKQDSIKLQKEFNESPAGKIKSKHPKWSNEDCKKIANNEVWIGMNIDMLTYSRGKADYMNIINYDEDKKIFIGGGPEYRYCWDKYKISCVYFKEDDIIYAFN